jgi:hypothetical protein
MPTSKAQKKNRNHWKGPERRSEKLNMRAVKILIVVSWPEFLLRNNSIIDYLIIDYLAGQTSAFTFHFSPLT